MMFVCGGGDVFGGVGVVGDVWFDVGIGAFVGGCWVMLFVKASCGVGVWGFGGGVGEVVRGCFVVCELEIWDWGNGDWGNGDWLVFGCSPKNAICGFVPPLWNSNFKNIPIWAFDGRAKESC